MTFEEPSFPNYADQENICSYDISNGVFTVPPGGNGVYYFSIYIYVDDGEWAGFEMRLNDDDICTTWPDHYNNGDRDRAPGSCSAVVEVVAGNMYLNCIMEIIFITAP